MKVLIIIATIFLTSCATTKPVPVHHQAKLVSIQWKSRSNANLTMLNMQKDTVRYRYRSKTVGRQRFKVGYWYTIIADTTKYRIENGCKIYSATIKHNQ